MLNETWRKSTKSNNNGACVEVRLIDGNVEVRDTKDGGQGYGLSFTPVEWDAFLDGATKGEFNIA